MTSAYYFYTAFYSRILSSLCILSTVYKGFGYEVVCTIHKHAGFECVDTVFSNKNILRMRCRCPQDTADTLQASLERQKLKFYFFPEKRLYFLMFITAVCFLFLLKLRWPKTKVSMILKCFHSVRRILILAVSPNEQLKTTCHCPRYVYNSKAQFKS